MALTVSASTGSKDIMIEVWLMMILIPSLHDTIDPIHHGPLLVDLFLILSVSGSIIYFGSIYLPRRGRGPRWQLTACGWVGYQLPMLCCTRSNSNCLQRHTEVPANERVSQEQYERRTAHLLRGGVASYHLPHLLTNKSFQIQLQIQIQMHPLYEKRTAHISASSWRRSSFLQPVHLLESCFGQ